MASIKQWAEERRRTKATKARERAEADRTRKRNCPNQGKAPKYDHFGWMQFGWRLTGSDSDRLYAYCYECGWGAFGTEEPYNGLRAAIGEYDSGAPVHPIYK